MMESSFLVGCARLAAGITSVSGESDILALLKDQMQIPADLFLFSPDLQEFFLPSGWDGIGEKARKVLKDTSEEQNRSLDPAVYQEALNRNAGAGFTVIPLGAGTETGGFLILQESETGFSEEQHKMLSALVSSALDRVALLRENEKLRLQEGLIRQEMLKEENHRLLGSMLGGITHDFNNILTGVSGFAQLIQMLDEDPETQDSVNEIITASEGGKKIISFLSRIKKIRLDENPAQAGLGTLLKDAVFGLGGLTAQLHPGKAVEDVIKIEGEGDPAVKAPPDLILSLFSHLLSGLLRGGAFPVYCCVKESDGEPSVEVKYEKTAGESPCIELASDSYFSFRLLSEALNVIYASEKDLIRLTFTDKRPKPSGKPFHNLSLLVYEPDARLRKMFEKYFVICQSKASLTGDREGFRHALSAGGYSLVIADEAGLDLLTEGEIPGEPPVLLTCSFGRLLNMDSIAKAPIKRILPKPFLLDQLERAAFEAMK